MQMGETMLHLRKSGRLTDRLKPDTDGEVRSSDFTRLGERPQSAQ